MFERGVSNFLDRSIRMIRLGSLVLAGIVSVASVASACTAQDMQNEALSKSIQELKAKAANTPVRVIVRLQPDATDAGVDAPQGKAELTKIMLAVGVSQIDEIKGQPLLVMELTASQLDQLLASGMVLSVQEDKIEGLY